MFIPQTLNEDLRSLLPAIDDVSTRCITPSAASDTFTELSGAAHDAVTEYVAVKPSLERRMRSAQTNTRRDHVMQQLPLTLRTLQYSNISLESRKP